MKPEIEKMINHSGLKRPDGKNRVQILNGDFDINGSKIILKKIIMMSINGVDIYDLESENIVNNSLRIYLSEPLNINPEEHYTYEVCEYDSDSMELNIDNTKYRVTDYSDFEYFVSDFNGDVKETVNSVMEAFTHWLLKYNK